VAGESGGEAWNEWNELVTSLGLDASSRADGTRICSYMSLKLSTLRFRSL
jgi:hypothetical protein